MPSISDAIVLPLVSRREVTGQGGLITGMNPTVFTTSDPLRLWIIQACVIIIITRVLSFGLRQLGQPKVIAELLGGILLGPTAFGRIPGFTEHIFPSVSLPYLSLVANIGFCLFLFLVGLEIDTSIIKRNAGMSIIVSLAGIALPFGLGTAISVPLYHHFIDPSVHFTYFMLFIGVAYSVTAFPVLCPILKEVKLFNTHIGTISLFAGVGSTIVAWILLALGVALVNAGSGLTALWISLACISFILFLSIPVKFALRWLAHKTGSIENGPSMFFTTVVMMVVWASGFFTDSIGVNAIFGAFLSGLIVPREGGLAIALTEKLEDIVSVIFLPLFFTFSGLNANLWLLDDSITWGFTIAVIALSLSGKFGGCTIASRLAGYGWRESSTIGTLMSCKGPAELIVLNVGLQAGILSQKIFSMFVLEALTLTVITTPLAAAFHQRERHNLVSEATPPLKCSNEESVITEVQPWRHRFTVVLDKLDHVPSAMAFIQLILPARCPSSILTSTTTSETSERSKIPSASVEVLRLIERSDRTSALMKSLAGDSSVHTDHILGIFRMFGELNGLSVTTSSSVVPYDKFACSVAEHAHRQASHLVVLPWAPFMGAGNKVTDTPDVTVGMSKPIKGVYNPFDALFGNVSDGKMERLPPMIHPHFIRDVFEQSKMDVALFIDIGERSGVHLGESVHIFLPFFGGPDDRLALEFVVQLCLNPSVAATVVRMVKREGVTDKCVRLRGEFLVPPLVAHLDGKLHGTRASAPRLEEPTVASTVGFLDTPYDQPTAHMRLQSETADNIIWSKYARPPSPSDPKADAASTRGLCQALARIHFSEAHTAAPVHAAIDHARTLQGSSARLLIVAGRSRRLAHESHDVEMKRLLETPHSGLSPIALEGMREAIGDVGAAMTLVMGSASAVVLQAAHVASD